MSDDTKWSAGRKWGTWGGWASAIVVALLAVVSRMESCVSGKVGNAVTQANNTSRIDSLERSQELTNEWIKEHKAVADARIKQLDSVDRNEAVLEKTVSDLQDDVNEIKADVRVIREHFGIVRPRPGGN